jgi:hypothetical protein
VSWYVCTIGKATPGNWELCKQVHLFGIPRSTTGRPHVQVGDHLLIWLGGRGYAAEAAVTGPARIPNSEEEAPWPGGTDRFAYVIPIEVVLEVTAPLYLPFVDNRQSGTNFPNGYFRRSLSGVPDEPAMHVIAALREKRDTEVLGAGQSRLDT